MSNSLPAHNAINGVHSNGQAAPSTPVADEALTRQYLTKAELALRSGYSATTIQRLKDTGKIRFFQPAGKGGRIFFLPNAIENDVSIDRTTALVTLGGKSKKLSGPSPRWRSPITGEQ